MKIAKRAALLRDGLVGAAVIFAALTTQSGISNAAVLNGGFEAPVVNTTNFSFAPPYLVPPNYVYIPPSAGTTPTVAGSWTYFAGAGLINGNDPGAFNGESGFVGSQYAFIQGQSSYISHAK